MRRAYITVTIVASVSIAAASGRWHPQAHAQFLQTIIPETDSH